MSAPENRGLPVNTRENSLRWVGNEKITRDSLEIPLFET